MKSRDSKIQDIIYRHMRQEVLSPEEERFLNEWTGQRPENAQLLTQLADEKEWKEYLEIRTDEDRTMKAYEQFLSQKGTIVSLSERPVRRMQFLRKWRWAAAAVVLLCALLVTWLLKPGRADKQSVVAVEENTVIQPGRPGAILTLADGSTLMLDSLNNGVVAQQNGIQVKLKNGGLAYEGTGTAPGMISFNTMSTPRGRQFQVTLPDGTHVWLNAASSIRYPTVFTGKERKVDITGEAYFEVAKNAKMPFRVLVNNIAELEVLGTSFNVNAYEKEASVNATLLEGSIRVNGTTIKPGQQAQIVTTDGKTGSLQPVKVIDDADIENVMAWKNGLINFEGATFDAIMRQLERWYDIQVVYENNKVPATRLAGKMTRGVSLDGLLKNLEALDVHYRLDGRKLIILQ